MGPRVGSQLAGPMGKGHPIHRVLTASCARRSFAARGFTLVELMTVLAVLGVVAASAVPGLRSFAASQKVKSLSYDMTSDLLLARSEALKRNVSVSMTAANADWASGWTLTAGTENISTRNPALESLSFAASPMVPTVITFDVNGHVSAPSTQMRMTVSVTGASADSAKRCIQLDLSGRARSLNGACA